MKRSLLLLLPLMATGAAVASPSEATPAASPYLAVEKVFERSNLKRAGYSLMTNRSDGNYFRSLQAKNDPALIKEIKAYLEEDKKKAFNVMDGFQDGYDVVILNIDRNGSTINVIFRSNDNGQMNLFVQGEPEAFE